MKDHAIVDAGGERYAADKVNGINYPRMKLVTGADGVVDDCSSDVPLAAHLVKSVDCHDFVIVIPSDQFRIHNGDHYFIKRVVEVDGAGTIIYFMFKTPVGPTRIHAKAIIAGGAEFTIGIYENPTITDDGTPIPGLNNDRDSTNTSLLQAFAGPTVADPGDLIWPSKVGSGKTPTVSPGFNYAIIAATDTTYLFKIEKVSSGENWLDVDFFWYEVE